MKSKLVNYAIILVAVLITILVSLSSQKDFVTVVCLIGGPLFSIIAVLPDALNLEQLRRNQLLPGLQILGSTIPIIGMYFGSFSAVFSSPIPYLYYFLLAICVCVHVMLSLISVIMSESD